jgi:hypothetical protein
MPDNRGRWLDFWDAAHPAAGWIGAAKRHCVTCRLRRGGADLSPAICTKSPGMLGGRRSWLGLGIGLIWARRLGTPGGRPGGRGGGVPYRPAKKGGGGQPRRRKSDNPRCQLPTWRWGRPGRQQVDRPAISPLTLGVAMRS